MRLRLEWRLRFVMAARSRVSFMRFECRIVGGCEVYAATG